MNLVIVVPCYKEEAVLPETARRLLLLLKEMKAEGQIDGGQILFVDDGSTDKTWSLIARYADENAEIAGLKLAANVGHQQALWAGLTAAVEKGDAVVSIDADLQDDPEAIKEMVRLYRQGVEVVYGVRRERHTDTWFKRTSAQAFYRLMESMDTRVVYNHADFRLLSRRALSALLEYPERNLFIRGLVASLGYPSAMVYYDRAERFAGESKYPLRRMIAFALDGITSFSVRPLRLITLFGLTCMLVSFGVIIYGIVRYFEGQTIVGWTSQLVSIWFIGGAILLACGIIGEYVGKIYKEVKRRPRFFVEKKVGF